MDSSNGQVRVLCLDPHELMLTGLRCRLVREPDLAVVGLLQDPIQLLASAERERPHVIVTEIDFNGTDVFGLISRLARRHAVARTVIYSFHARAGCVQAALTAGAFGYVSKSDPSEELVQAVRETPKASDQVLSSSIRAALAVNGDHQAGCDPTILAQLTPREIEVLCLIGRGMSRIDIAAAIRRSPKTVDAHRASIMGKLGFKDRVELARFAIREGIVSV